MKQVSYIFALLAYFFMLSSCEKEEFGTNNNNNGTDDEYIINPEDTAGVIVPEGYSLVIFPGSKSMTRAVTGTDTRISHLQYIIYEKTENNAYIQLDANVEMKVNLTSWPLSAFAISLPQNKEYRVVFLGNVNKSIFGSKQTTEVLTGTGDKTKYNDARIILPEVEFTDKTMYHFGKNDFNTNSGTAYVPITLKRIVSRNDITREGLSGTFAEEVTNGTSSFKDAYWKQLIKTKLVNDIFTGEKSAFRYQVAEGMKKHLIYPLIYIGLHEPNDANSLQGYYSAVKGYITEWSVYQPGTIYINEFDKLKTYYSNAIKYGDEYPNNIFIVYAQYLYDIFVNEASKDPTTLTNALTHIYTDNCIIKELSGGITSQYPTIDAAINKVVNVFNKKYTSGFLLPWKLMADKAAVIEINSSMPSAMDFDLNIQSKENARTKCYAIKNAPDDDKVNDNYISIVTLGEPNETNKLSISSISSATSKGNTINDIPTKNSLLESNRFTAGSFKRNLWSLSKQSLENVKLKTPTKVMEGEEYQQKIKVSMYNIFNNCMNPKKSGKTLTIGGEPHSIAIETNLSIQDIISMQHNILNILTDDYTSTELGQDKDKLSFRFVTFISPDVSPDNIDETNITTIWNTSCPDVETLN